MRRDYVLHVGTGVTEDVVTIGIKTRTLNLWAVSWYYEGLGQEVIYRETPEGPEVVAVGREEVWGFKRGVPLDEQLKHKIYQDS